MRKFLLLILCFISVLLGTLSYAEENEILLSPGKNIIALSVGNKWKKDLAEVSITIDKQKLTSGVEVKVYPSSITVRKGAFSTDKVFLSVNMKTSEIVSTLEIPVVFSDNTGNRWEYKVPASIEANQEITTKLASNFPNPFNPSTTIRYSLIRDEHVTLSVYNSIGQLVIILVDERHVAGMQSVVWDGNDENGLKVSSGLYFYRIEAGDFTDTKRMMMLE